jgi:hypothetical protein
MKKMKCLSLSGALLGGVIVTRLTGCKICAGTKSWRRLLNRSSSPALLTGKWSTAG